MKIRIAATVAIAAAIGLGATGCGLVAPQSTLEVYAPSDGVDVSMTGVDLRNVMLIADESGENFNVVFGAVNRTGKPAKLTINFAGEGSDTASADFTLPTGNTLFGNPEGEEAPVLVNLPGLKVGSTIKAYFQVPGADEKNHNVTVLDGTLKEYQDYVLPIDFTKADEKPSAVKQETADEKASESTINDDQQP
ncbi:DNA modification methylase [Leucobacter sp. CSA2]|uniref:DNA modification methylase n=1 Tax=Leucobacter edaphi TaxID=2796472 RepID=A0A934UYD1_9MICO|nr:DNA modification methylase [Leucobacter edaphi]MBK0422373.1 DNA modification methylase [Leucobacter edaphi]